jgi:phosphoribosyl-ATP pyrophosphohydrolase
MVDSPVMTWYVLGMPRRKKPVQSTVASGRDRQGRLVQARISDEAYEQLAARADKDTRSIANYVERLVYQHLGIVEAAE